MRKYNTFALLLFILFSLLTGCEKWTKQDKYKRPDWLPGKLYTAVSAQDNLTMFDECLRLAGLDTILDVSGSWTVFAPNDDAMEEYLSENHYNSITDIPINELQRMAKFHIIQDAWSLEQLQSIGAYGWRDRDNQNSNYYAYKFQTMLKDPIEKYWIKQKSGSEKIVIDSTIADGFKRVVTDSRKYVPIFYDKYLDINGLTSEDYSFYFDRPFEYGNVYYSGAKILRHDIFAENGFVHIIDQVVEPMLNAKELLERELPGESYKLFMAMVYWYYPTFVPNMVATYNQPSVRVGGLVDTLWNLNYSPLSFSLNEELIGFEGSNYNETLVKHNGLFISTDDAFRAFIDGILTVKSGFPHWSNYQSLPMDIVEIIVNGNIKSSPIYPSTNQYQQIFKEDSRFHQKEEDIIRSEFGSNCTFIGLNSYIPDRVFTSVTGPVFCRPGYTVFRLAMQYAGIEDVIANHEGELYFFPIPDNALQADSSLILNWIDRERNIYNFTAFDRRRQRSVTLGYSAIRNLILNHAGTSISMTSDNKEIIRTLRGNNVTWDHSNNTLRGAIPSMIGYHGTIVTTCTPVPLSEPADNGETWSVNCWLNFGD